MKVRSMRNCMMSLFLAPLILFSSCESVNTKESNQVLQETTNTSHPLKQEKKLILFFGNGLTAGFGLKPEEAFPALIQSKIDSLGLAFEVLNAGLIEETSSDGRERIDWMLNKDVDIFVMEIGVGDQQAGIPFEKTQENLQAILDTVRSRNPHTTIILAGVENLRNPTSSDSNKHSKIYPDLAAHNDVALVPCILKNVDESAQRIHENSLYPTAEGHKVVAQNVWQVLKPFLTSEISVTGNY